MEKDLKDILLKDLCARLPHKLYVEDEYGDIICLDYTDLHFENYFNAILEGNVKPYLFPLSSMNEEQKQEYTYIVNYLSPDDTENWQEGEFVYVGGQMCQLMHFFSYEPSGL